MKIVVSAGSNGPFFYQLAQVQPALMGSLPLFLEFIGQASSFGTISEQQTWHHRVDACLELIFRRSRAQPQPSWSPVLGLGSNQRGVIFSDGLTLWFRRPSPNLEYIAELELSEEHIHFRRAVTTILAAVVIFYPKGMVILDSVRMLPGTAMAITSLRFSGDLYSASILWDQAQEVSA